MVRCAISGYRAATVGALQPCCLLMIDNNHDRDLAILIRHIEFKNANYSWPMQCCIFDVCFLQSAFSCLYKSSICKRAKSDGFQATNQLARWPNMANKQFQHCPK